MPVSLAQDEQQARLLSAGERARLVEVLLESLREGPPAEVDAAWAVEIEARVAGCDRREAEVHAAEDVFAEARRRAR